MARRVKLAVAVVRVVSAMPAGRWVRHTRPWESPIQRAHRLCRECGLDDDEVDRFIDTKRNAGLTREQELDLFYATFEDEADAELSEPCAVAVLDAAGQRQ